MSNKENREESIEQSEEFIKYIEEGFFSNTTPMVATRKEEE